MEVAPPIEAQEQAPLTDAKEVVASNPSLVVDEPTIIALNEAAPSTLREAAPINLEEEEPATITTDDTLQLKFLFSFSLVVGTLLFAFLSLLFLCCDLYGKKIVA